MGVVTPKQLIEVAKQTGSLQYEGELAIEWRKPEIVVSRTVGLWVILKKFDTKDWPQAEIEEHIERWLRREYPSWLPAS